LAGTLFISMKTIQGSVPAKEILVAIERIYLDLDRGKQKIIPEELEGEYQTYASKRYKEMGNSSRSSNKRSFLIENAHRIHPNEFRLARDYISNLYGDGYGLKLIGKHLNLGPTRVRTLFRILGITINKGRNVVYDKTREIRSENLKEKYVSRTGWFRSLERRTNKTSRGIQGYYYNQSRGKYVWLRSTYEYIYAKWLDRNKIDWDVEQQTYQLEGTTYRPDFFIYENDSLVKIVEIKGYWATGVRKTRELSETLNITVVLVTDIKPYYKQSYKKELQEWKHKRTLYSEERSRGQK
jgi:hypothetical protein